RGPWRDRPCARDGSEPWEAGPGDRAQRERRWPSPGEAREVFQQGDHSGVIEATSPLDAEGTEQFLNRRRRRKRHAEGTSGFHDEPQVLVVQVDLEARVVGVGEVVRLFLIQALRS